MAFEKWKSVCGVVCLSVCSSRLRLPSTAAAVLQGSPFGLLFECPVRSTQHNYVKRVKDKQDAYRKWTETSPTALFIIPFQDVALRSYFNIMNLLYNLQIMWKCNTLPDNSVWFSLQFSFILSVSSLASFNKWGYLYCECVYLWRCKLCFPEFKLPRSELNTKTIHNFANVPCICQNERL